MYRRQIIVNGCILININIFESLLIDTAANKSTLFI